MCGGEGLNWGGGELGGRGEEEGWGEVVDWVVRGMVTVADQAVRPPGWAVSFGFLATSAFGRFSSSFQGVKSAWGDRADELSGTEKVNFEEKLFNACCAMRHSM